MSLPFIKWPGGKRRQLGDISAGFADLDLSRCLYVEPFLGAGLWLWPLHQGSGGRSSRTTTPTSLGRTPQFETTRKGCGTRS